MADTPLIKIKPLFDIAEMERLSAVLQVAMDKLRASMADVGRRDHAVTQLRRKLYDLLHSMETTPDALTATGWAWHLREILEDDGMATSNFGRGVETSGASTEAEKSRARMEDVNRSTRPGERTLADVQREQRDHA